MISLTKEDRLAAFFEQGYSVSFDPPGDGNSQFHAMAHALSCYGIYRSTQLLRANIVRHLENNPNYRDGMPFELFMRMSFSDYVGQIARYGTRGDQLTLHLHLRFITFSSQSFQLLELKEGQIFHQMTLAFLAE